MLWDWDHKIQASALFGVLIYSLFSLVWIKLRSLHMPLEGWPGWVDLSGCLCAKMNDICPQTDTHPSTNLSQHRVTSLITNNTKPNCRHCDVIKPVIEMKGTKTLLHYLILPGKQNISQSNWVCSPRIHVNFHVAKQHTVSCKILYHTALPKKVFFVCDIYCHVNH